jgi:hypothetical protein
VTTVVRSRPGSRVGSRFGPSPTLPETQAQAQAMLGLTLSNLWLMREASGNIVDVVGGVTLTAGGAPSYNVPLGDCLGIRYASGAADRHTTSGAAPDFAAASGLRITVFTPDMASTAFFSGIAGRLNAAAADGAYSTLRGNDAAGRAQLVLADGASGSQRIITTTGNVRVRQLVCAVEQVDRAANLGRYRVSIAGRLISEDTGDITGYGTFTGAAQEAGLGGFWSPTSILGGNNIAWHAFAAGAQCEGAAVPSRIAQAMGFG